MINVALSLSNPFKTPLSHLKIISYLNQFEQHCVSWQELRPFKTEFKGKDRKSKNGVKTVCCGFTLIICSFYNVMPILYIKENQKSLWNKIIEKNIFSQKKHLKPYVVTKWSKNDVQKKAMSICNTTKTTWYQNECKYNVIKY